MKLDAEKVIQMPEMTRLQNEKCNFREKVCILLYLSVHDFNTILKYVCAVIKFVQKTVVNHGQYNKFLAALCACHFQC